jgi:hypothetical protein
MGMNWKNGAHFVVDIAILLGVDFSQGGQSRLILRLCRLEKGSGMRIELSVALMLSRTSRGFHTKNFGDVCTSFFA